MLAIRYHQAVITWLGPGCVNGGVYSIIVCSMLNACVLLRPVSDTTVVVAASTTSTTDGGTATTSTQTVF